MGAYGMIYKIDSTGSKWELILEEEKWPFLRTKKFDELAEKRIVSPTVNDICCDFAMVVNGKELNAIFEECGDEERVREEYDFYLILWNI